MPNLIAWHKNIRHQLRSGLPLAHLRVIFTIPKYFARYDCCDPSSCCLNYRTFRDMPPPRRKLQATVEETLTPPDELGEGQYIVRIKNAIGNNLYNVELPEGKTLLAELDARFRSKIWLKRGGYVLVDTKTLADRENKIDGQIVNVVRDEKAWRKASFWPKDFVKKPVFVEDSDEEESTVGKMPPSDDESST